jgi:hypothetical protein
METNCQATMVEENPQVNNVGLNLKSQQMGFKETTHIQMDTSPYLRWESSNFKGLTVSA